MTKQTYSAHAQPGQGISFPSCKIIKGFNGIVKCGGAEITRSGLYSNRTQAVRWAMDKAAEYRAYRSKHGEGIEEKWKRDDAAKRAERRRWGRIDQQARPMYELLQRWVEDADLVKDMLPTQALKRLDDARKIIALVETPPEDPAVIR